MKIGEFAERTGISKDTIRYYEKIGLLHPSIQNNYRHYSNDDIDTIETILKLKQTGFTLHEIKMLFEWAGTTDPASRLTDEDRQNIVQIKKVFQEMHVRVVQKENAIKQIKHVLLTIDDKITQLLKRDQG